MLEKINETTNFLKSKGFINPDVGIALGTGFGVVAAQITNRIEIDYQNIPNFPVSTVDSHEGKLIFGELGGKKVVVMKGRFHYYEGYASEQVTFPVRVLKYLGVKHLFLSNAAGGLNPNFKVGDIMIINDHINLIPNPLIGQNDERIGVRFPDMSEPYNKCIIEKAMHIADENNIKVHKGVYLATTGPTFETPAEYKFFRIAGADAVGMSTTPEVIVARHMGLSCFAMSVIVNLGTDGEVTFTTHESVQHEAGKIESNITIIITELIRAL